jgi:hypothetical protein
MFQHDLPIFIICFNDLFQFYDAIQLLAATGNLNDCDILPLKNSSFLDFQQYVTILQPIE